MQQETMKSNDKKGKVATNVNQFLIELTSMTPNKEESSDSQHILNNIHQSMNGEETLDQKQTAITIEDSNNVRNNPMTRNRRVVEGVIDKPILTTKKTINDNKTDLGPIVGYAEEPLLPLAEACAPLIDIIPRYNGLCSESTGRNSERTT